MTGSPDDRHRAGARREDAVEVQHQRRLAGAVRPQQGDPLARVHVQVDTEQRLVATGVRVGHAAQVEHGHAHPSRTPTVTTAATAAGDRASAHWAGVATSGATTGIRPDQPRLTMARCTRSPRS